MGHAPAPIVEERQEELALSIKVVNYAGWFGWNMRKYFPKLAIWAYLKLQYFKRDKDQKDFIDMYFLIRHFGLEQVMQFYKTKYPEYSEYRAMLSLTYFEDAEQNPMPKMFVDITWDKMKFSVQKAVENYNNNHN